MGQKKRMLCSERVKAEPGLDRTHSSLARDRYTRLQDSHVKAERGRLKKRGDNETNGSLKGEGRRDILKTRRGW